MFSLSLFSSPVARRCTSLTFTRDSLHVVVGDRSGEVYLFDVHEQVKGQRSESSRDGSESGVPAAHWADEDGDESGGGSLLLGHMSMLLEVVRSSSLCHLCLITLEGGTPFYKRAHFKR